MNKYYRVCKEYHGEEFTFIPTECYEHLEETSDGDIIIKDKEDIVEAIKEVCFAKYIPNCFFAISMFIKENEIYHIYETTQEPCVLAYKCTTGDFKASQEVRYRVPVKSRCIGKFTICEDFHYAITSLYENNGWGDKFASSFVLDSLKNEYNLMYNRIEYANKDIEKEFNHLKKYQDESIA